MDSGCYKIEILHFLNPHLIWIERKDEGKEIVLEQVGVFGVLPLLSSITEKGEIFMVKDDQWMPAVNKALQNFRETYEDIYFTPKHIDRRSSIFNDNIHQFGDIFGFNRTKKVFLSAIIVKIGYAYVDECAFYKKLSSGKIRTKLNTVQTDEVIKAIEKYFKATDKSRKKQQVVKENTTIFQTIKDVSAALTVKNLQMHNQNSKEIEKLDIYKVIEEKTKDLNMCKIDTNVVSLGRGYKRTKSDINSDITEKSLNSSERLKQRVEYSKQPAESLKAVKRYVESSGSRKVSAEMSEANERVELQMLEPEPEMKWKEVSDDVDDDCIAPQCKLHSERPPKPLPKKVIVYGPPAHIKQQKIRTFIDDLNEGSEKSFQLKDEKTKWTEDGEKQDDSDINVKITNIDKLEFINNKMYALDAQKLTDSLNEAINNSKIGKNRVPTEKSENVSEKSEIVSEKAEKLPMFLRKKLEMFKKLDSDKIKQSNDDNRRSLSRESSDNEIAIIKEKLKAEYTIKAKAEVKPVFKNYSTERHVNPFLNLDGSKSVFVDNLIKPILMVHSKNNNLVLPQSRISDISFKADIRQYLRNFHIKEPSRLQSVSWMYILRGHSVFMVAPSGSGKTLGYVPAVCNLTLDYNHEIISVGPITLIVCASIESVNQVSMICKSFLGEKVLACYHGLDPCAMTASVLNGCSVMVTTPSMICRLLVTDLGVDLRRLTTVVFDDCERLFDVYQSEVKTIQYYVKQMLKNRIDKKLKVQYVVASRKWCDEMVNLAKKAPDTIIAISAFQECVLYSKTNTSVNFVLKDKKLDCVKDFLDQTDRTKRTVIVCRSNDEIEYLETSLRKKKYTTFACDNDMSVHNLYNMNVGWSNYKDPFNGPILICCDGNLTHLNVTNANYLIHYSMPKLFSMFCKRFAVLNDNYASIFKPQSQDVRIKIILEDNNVEQLPKILNFLKRCTSQMPEALDIISKNIIKQKELAKAEKFVPICKNLLTLSECADMWHCENRHAIFKDYDSPKDWMPHNGMIKFKILHYDTAVSYSARLLSHITKSGTTKYPKQYSTLSLKMGMYYSKECNKKLHGTPKLGDICAVAPKQNFYARCQVIKIVSYQKNQPHNILVRLIDEERLTIVKDVMLYYLPDEFKAIETYVVNVRLANIKPQDKDITFSDIAKNVLKKEAERNDQLYLRGQVVLTVGNTIFVDTLEVCQDLAVVNETVVTLNFKNDLLENHAIIYPEHVVNLKELCRVGHLDIEKEDETSVLNKNKSPVAATWAYLPKGEINEVTLSYTKNVGKFFVRLIKFHKCLNLLLDDIYYYVTDKPRKLDTITVGDIVLTKLPGEEFILRARIEKIIDDNKVECFFVDYGDSIEVPITDLAPITDNLIQKLPFQAIECRLVGIKPHNEEWSEFSTNWFKDLCHGNEELKRLHAKCYIKEKAEITGGNCHGIVLLDTNSTDGDIIVNKKMIELNLAKQDDDVNLLDEPFIIVANKEIDSDKEQLQGIKEEKTKETKKGLVPIPIKELPIKVEDPVENKQEKQVSLNDVFGKPIRSVPLVSDDVDIDDYDCNIDLRDLGGVKGLKNIFDIMNPNTDVPKCDTIIDDDDGNSPLNTTPGLPMIDYQVKELETPELSEQPQENEVSKVKEKRDETDRIQKLDETDGFIENDTKKVFKEDGLNDSEIEISCNIADELEISRFKSEFDSDDLSDSDVKELGNVSGREEIVINVSNTSPNDIDDPKIVTEYPESSVSPKSNLFALLAETHKRIDKNERDALNSSKTKYDSEINKSTDHFEKKAVNINFNSDSEVNEAPKPSNNNIKTSDMQKPVKSTKNYENKSLDSDDLSSTDVSVDRSYILVTKTAETHKIPKVIWQQTKSTITIKIQLIGVEKYTLKIEDRSIEFHCEHNDTTYYFQLELYGVINKEKVVHANKGQYIRVFLQKIMPKNWLNLSKEGKFKRWIIYDIDSIVDNLSDEEDVDNFEPVLENLRRNLREDSDSDEFEVLDDIDPR